MYNFSNSGFNLKDLVAALLQKVSISKKNNQPNKTCGLHIYFDSASSLVIWFIVEGFKLLFGLACYCLCEINFGLKAPKIEAAVWNGVTSCDVCGFLCLSIEWNERVPWNECVPENKRVLQNERVPWNERVLQKDCVPQNEQALEIKKSATIPKA